MPTLTQEQLTDIEIEMSEMSELISDQYEIIEELETKNAALEAALLRVRKERDG